MSEVIYGLIGFIGTTISIITLLIYFREIRKIEPKVIQIVQRVMDTGDFQILAMVSNVGNRTAKDCSAKIYVQDNPIEDLSFPPIDSPLGRLGVDWPKATSFETHRNTPIMLRGYLPSKYEGIKVHVRLFSKGKEFHRSDPFTLTKVKPDRST